MNLWTSVMLAWVGVNIVLVALMWRYQWLKERSARAPASGQSAPLPDHEASGRCPRFKAAWPCEPPEAADNRPSASTELRAARRRFVALTAADAGAATWAGHAACTSASDAVCRLHELNDEIRMLKLTVAELALDKAMLSAAASRRKAVS